MARKPRRKVEADVEVREDHSRSHSSRGGSDRGGSDRGASWDEEHRSFNKKGVFFDERVNYRDRSQQDDEYKGDKMVAPPGFDGPVKNRDCTDIFWTMLISLVWAAFSFVGYFAITNGDIRLLLHPLDYGGNICGTDYNGVNMTDYPYLYSVNYWHTGICLKECPVLPSSSNDEISNGNTGDSTTDQTDATYDGNSEINRNNVQNNESAAEIISDNVFQNNESAAEIISDNAVPESIFDDVDDVESEITSEESTSSNVATTSNNTSKTDTDVSTVVNYFAASGNSDVADVRTLITYSGLHQIDGAQFDPNTIEIPPYYTTRDNLDALSCITRTSDGGEKDICFPDNDHIGSWSSDGINKGKGFAYYLAESRPILNHCVITRRARDSIGVQVKDNATLAFVDDGFQLWKYIYTDIYTAREYIFIYGFGGALLISFIYIGILRMPLLLNSVVWGSLFATVGLVAVGGYYAHHFASRWSNEDPQHFTDFQINVTRIGSYVCFGISGILFLFMFCLRREIQLAIACIRETSKAIQRMPTILLVPFIQGICLIGFVVVFVIYGIHLASMGDFTARQFDIPFGNLSVVVRSFQYDQVTTYIGWGMIFTFFWTCNFIIALGDMIVAMIIAKWYFTRNKKDTGNQTVISSICSVLYFHLGTVAFGSLILAIIQFIRAILGRIQREAERVGGKCGGGAAKAIICCFQCCLCCFEKCIRFLNKNAYIQTAIFGRPFCASAKDAFYLILRNMGRIGAVSYVSGFVLFVGKLFISAATTVVAYYLMVENIIDDLHSIAAPTALVFILAYFLANMFLDLFEMGISTTLQCFVADEEMFDGADCYAEGQLQNWIEKHQND